MAIESHPVPELSKTALKMLDEQYRQSMGVLCRQTLDALGLDAALGYHVDFDKGVITREVKDEPKADPA